MKGAWGQISPCHMWQFVPGNCFSGSVETSRPTLHMKHPWRRVSFPLEAEIQLRPCQSRHEAVHACLVLQVLVCPFWHACASVYMP